MFCSTRSRACLRRCTGALYMWVAARLPVIFGDARMRWGCHFEEAAVFLHGVALLDPQKHAETEYAARFLLDAMKVLAQARPECVDSFPALAAAVDAHVCKSAGAADRAESCAAIAKMQ